MVVGDYQIDFVWLVEIGLKGVLVLFSDLVNVENYEQLVSECEIVVYVLEMFKYYLGWIIVVLVVFNILCIQ